VYCDDVYCDTVTLCTVKLCPVTLCTECNAVCHNLQIPYAPASAGIDPKGMGPWVKLFQNAREWCDAN
jgi:hypothetical protein